MRACVHARLDPALFPRVKVGCVVCTVSAASGDARLYLYELFVGTAQLEMCLKHLGSILGTRVLNFVETQAAWLYLDPGGHLVLAAYSVIVLVCAIH